MIHPFTETVRIFKSKTALDHLFMTMERPNSVLSIVLGEIRLFFYVIGLANARCVCCPDRKRPESIPFLRRKKKENVWITLAFKNIIDKGNKI